MAKNKKTGGSTRRRSSTASFKPYDAAIHAARVAATVPRPSPLQRPQPQPLIQLTGATDYHRSTSHKIYVLTATHHIHDAQPHLFRQCASKTTVCGVFTSRQMAERAQEQECRRIGFDATTSDNASGAPIYHFSNGSYCTTFQIDEREIWSFPCAEQKVVLDQAAERAPWNGSGWMTKNRGTITAAAAAVAGSQGKLKEAEAQFGGDDDGEEKKEERA